jgi:hypothetical protein
VPQLQWCPAAALQAKRLHDGGHSTKLCALLQVFKQPDSRFLVVVANSKIALELSGMNEARCGAVSQTVNGCAAHLSPYLPGCYRVQRRNDEHDKEHHLWNNRRKKGNWHIMEITKVEWSKNQGVAQGSYRWTFNMRQQQ